MQKNAKSKRKDAEKAAVWFVYEHMDVVVHAKSIQTKWQRVDFFGSDVMGKKINGQTVYIQVTAGQDSAINARKRKLEAIPWDSRDIVLLLQLKQRQDLVNERKKQWFFKVWQYRVNITGERLWEAWEKPVEIPKKWFKAYKKKETNHVY